ncbi:MAG TPA: hypothetical protein VND54_02330 [Candidatus Saccharimonadales bacterium]|nr:hypothetical protein [Candidatus Saccharimonadales bacterium]
MLMLLIWSPNVIWQIANGFPTLTYVLNHQRSSQSGGGIVDFLVLFLVLLFLLTPLWIAGFVSLFRNPALPPIGIACATPMIIHLLVGFYYPAPTIPIVKASSTLGTALGLLLTEQEMHTTRGGASPIRKACPPIRLSCCRLERVTSTEEAAPPGCRDILTHGVESLLHGRLKGPMAHLVGHRISRRKEEQPTPGRRLEAVQHLLWFEARGLTRGDEVFRRSGGRRIERGALSRGRRKRPLSHGPPSFRA